MRPRYRTTSSFGRRAVADQRRRTVLQRVYCDVPMYSVRYLLIDWRFGLTRYSWLCMLAFVNTGDPTGSARSDCRGGHRQGVREMKKLLDSYRTTRRSAGPVHLTKARLSQIKG